MMHSLPNLEAIGLKGFLGVLGVAEHGQARIDWPRLAAGGKCPPFTQGIRTASTDRTPIRSGVFGLAASWSKKGTAQDDASRTVPWWQRQS